MDRAPAILSIKASHLFTEHTGMGLQISRELKPHIWVCPVKQVIAVM